MATVTASLKDALRAAFGPCRCEPAFTTRDRHAPECHEGCMELALSALAEQPGADEVIGTAEPMYADDEYNGRIPW